MKQAKVNNVVHLLAFTRVLVELTLMKCGFGQPSQKLCWELFNSIFLIEQKAFCQDFNARTRTNGQFWLFYFN